MGDAPLLKDFVDRESVEAVVAAVTSATAGIDSTEVMERILDADWAGRALKQRIRHIAVTVREFLPSDYEEALTIMRHAAQSMDAGGMSVWAFNDFVEEYGVDEPDISLAALEQFTKLASAEFAVRPFIRRYPQRMAAQMLRWSQHPDPAVRRLASEGYRPRLPWGMGLPELKKDPAPVVPVLEALHDDPSENVRRSVANNLNDISKDHPDLVIELLAKWDDGSPEHKALTKHALRTALKRGHRGALGLLGFAADPQVTVTDVALDPPAVAVGGSVQLSFRLESSRQQSVMVDYAVTFQNRSGTGSRKVFKGKVAELSPDEVLPMRRKISLVPQTTRQIYPGPHLVEIQVNGVVLGTGRFDVTE